MLIDQYVNYLESFDIRELSEEHFQFAKDQGWLVVFGHSDDCIELRGYFTDETYYDSKKFAIDKDGLIPSWDQIDHDDENEVRVYFERKKATPILTLYVFDNDEFEDEQFMWVFTCSYPHETFKIYDGDEPYCVGIVVDFKKLVELYK